MKILGIETSCDETSGAVIEGNHKNQKVTLLSNIVSSSINFHSKTGGIIPEIAAREQIKYIISVIQKSLLESDLSFSDIDAIAVTTGPGLIGSLLVGVETAKTLSFVFKKPIIPVNHLFGHIYANWLTTVNNNDTNIEFPAIALLVSGGHTDLILMKDHKNIQWLGGTRDDAAGEALDKIGRLLNISYPAGSKIEQLATEGKPNAFKFPRPMIGSQDFDFSFSGLKTAVLREVKTIEKLDAETIKNICASTQQAIIDILIKKTLKAAQEHTVKSILLGGGVAANEELKKQFAHSIKHKLSNTKIFVPEKFLCTDNAAMIATAAFYNYTPTPWDKISANPELYFD